MAVADVQIARRAGQAVVLDACGQPHTADALRATIRVLEGKQAAEAPPYRQFWAQAVTWRRAVLAALEQAEADDVATGE